MTLDEHEEDCPNRLAHERGDCGAENEECECEHVSFSWTPCEGCGSTLGGAREALTVWPSLRHAFILPEEG